MQENNTKRKRYLLGIGTIFLALGIITLVYFNKQNSNSELSPRTKKFLQKNYPNFRESTIENNRDKIFATKCFSLNLPYISSNQKINKVEEKCIFQANIVEPNAQIVIHNESLQTSLGEHPSIAMRRQNTQVYLESNLEDSILRFDTKDSVVFFATDKSELITIAFNNIANTSNVKNEDIIKILQSIKFIE